MCFSLSCSALISSSDMADSLPKFSWCIFCTSATAWPGSDDGSRTSPDPDMIGYDAPVEKQDKLTLK